MATWPPGYCLGWCFYDHRSASAFCSHSRAAAIYLHLDYSRR